MTNMRKTEKSEMLAASKTAPFAPFGRLPVSFVYGNVRYEGIPAPIGEESRLIDGNIVRHEVKARLDVLDITLICDEYRDYPVKEYSVYFHNSSDRDSDILEAAYCLDTVLSGVTALIYGNGDTCGEDGYEFFKTELNERFSLSPVDGTSCRGAFPYMRFLTEDGGINLAVGWPAMWNVSAERTSGGVHVTVGQMRCHTYLKPGETYRTPRVTLMNYIGAEDGGRNLWRAWYFDHVLPRENGSPLPPKLCLHTWMIDGFPEFTGITEENQLSGIDDYLQGGLKPDIWWIDAGWYPCDHDWPHTGTWECDRARLPRGLKPVSDKCHENGIQLLLWFEPERVVPDTWLMDEHPEWLLHNTLADGNPNPWKLLDLGNEEALEWLISHVDNFIKENGIDIYRQDFNFDPKPIWAENEGEDRVGMLENKHVQGYLRYYNELILRNPGLWIDSCSSGGRRNDLETMRYAVPLHYTDVGYGHHLIKQKQHREMFEWIPYFRAHTMNWDSYDNDGTYDQAKAKPVDEFAYYNAIAPSLTSTIEHYATDEEFAIGRKMHPIWRKAAELTQFSDYYPLTECSKDPKSLYAMQFDRPEENCGFIEAIANISCTEGTFTLHPKAEAGYVYFVWDGETNVIKGLNSTEFASFTFELEPREGRIWFYEKRPLK